MEAQSILDDDEKKPVAETTAYHSNIDNSRPFRSVKEAVAIFGEKFLTGVGGGGGGGGGPREIIYSPKKRFVFPEQETPVCSYYTPSPSPQKSQFLETSPSSSFAASPRKSPVPFKDNDDDEQQRVQPIVFMESLKKLETELEETKMELKLLKERESETEVALASLNAELHKNMSKLAQAEAAAASKAILLASRSINNSLKVPEHGRNYNYDQEIINYSNSSSTEEEEKKKKKKKKEKEKELMVRLESSSSTTLAQFLNTADRRINNNSTNNRNNVVLKGDDEEMLYGKKEEKKVLMMMMMVKKKPIIPLVGDLFSRRKGASTTMHNPLFASSSRF